MLIEFKCENFRSFKGEAVLSMLPVNSYKEHVENLVVTHVAGSNADGLLSTAVIYGTNASGKTNLLRAVDCARALVLGVLHPGQLVRRDCFIGNDAPTRFTFSFVTSGVRYEYGFSFDDDGVVAEELRVRPKAERLVFRRARTENGSYVVKQGSNYPGITTKLKGFFDNGLILGLLAKYDIDPCYRAFEWLSSGLSIINREVPVGYDVLLEKLARLGQDNFESVIKTIGSADLGITDAQLDVNDLTEEDRAVQKETASRFAEIFEVLTGQKPDGALQLPDKKVALQFRHMIDGKQVGFGFDEESLGTITMLDLACDFIDAIDTGKTLFVDEAERCLHPVLLKNLVSLFSNHEVNAKGAQLVFTTHDLSFLSNDLLRRDQIWFVEKDAKTGASELYPLSSFSPRKDESLMNRYLYGAYGAVPFIDGVLIDGR